jgi:ankyrin repeat protein
LEQALLAQDTVEWSVQRLLIVEAIEAGAHVDHIVEHMHGTLITSLYLAVVQADVELIKYVLRKRADCQLSIYDNGTIYSYVDSVLVAKQLLESGVQLMEKEGALFGGILHGLMHPEYRALELMELYLRHGANPNCADWCGDTPLHVLARTSSRYTDALPILQAQLQALITAGANPTIKNNASKTVVDMITQKEIQGTHYDIFRKVLFEAAGK